MGRTSREPTDRFVEIAATAAIAIGGVFAIAASISATGTRTLAAGIPAPFWGVVGQALTSGSLLTIVGAGLAGSLFVIGVILLVPSTISRDWNLLNLGIVGLGCLSGAWLGLVLHPAWSLVPPTSSTGQVIGHGHPMFLVGAMLIFLGLVAKHRLADDRLPGSRSADPAPGGDRGQAAAEAPKTPASDGAGSSVQDRTT